MEDLWNWNNRKVQLLNMSNTIYLAITRPWVDLAGAYFWIYNSFLWDKVKVTFIRNWFCMTLLLSNLYKMDFNNIFELFPKIFWRFIKLIIFSYSDYINEHYFLTYLSEASFWYCEEIHFFVMLLWPYVWYFW